MAIYSSVAFDLLALIGDNAAVATPAASASPTGFTYPPGFDITRSWVNLSPYSDAPGFGLAKGFPEGCELSEVHVLHRHAQRYPTAYPLDGNGMEKFAQKLVNYTKSDPDQKVGRGPLAFLNKWKYLLGMETLLPTGAATVAASGAEFWNQYGHLLYRAGRGKAV